MNKIDVNSIFLSLLYIFMDDDIRDFLDRVEQKRLYEQQKKRKGR